MCMPSTPKVTPAPVAEKIAAPTYADASVQKAGANERRRMAGLSSQDIKTSYQGLSDEPNVKKKQLLGQ